jgi:FemAB-related protein (PEP-CTERM system-associated)
MAATKTFSSSLRVMSVAEPRLAVAWQQFVDSRPAATNFHRWGWKQVIENAFGWPTWYLLAEEAGIVRGILPLVWQRSRLFGSFVTSMPFLNGGGIVADDPQVERLLLDEAIAITRRLKADHLELRHRSNHHLGLPTKTSKLVVVKAVNADSERMFQELDKKVRADVRKSQKSGFTAEFAGEEFFEDFYRVFAVNMRDLGTPVYSPRFFREIFRAFPRGTWICRVRLGECTVAASVLTGYRDSIEVAWSSSLRGYLSLKPNMFLYWNLLCFAGQQGYRFFDFGRSTAGSGTHKFKMQWGAQELPLYWNYWLHGDRELPQINPENPKYRMFIWGWQKLPVFFTRLIGPRIVRCLP